MTQHTDHATDRQTGERIDFSTGAPVAGTLDVHWNHGRAGRRSPAEPPLQVHHHDEHTVLLRQSKTLNYEAPFVFLLFGNDRALLLDTGAVADPERFPLRATVDGLIDRWLAAHPRPHYELVVAHTHGHGDHVAADPQFADRPDTTVVAREADAVREFFGFGESWPTGTVAFDLGGRVLELIGSPGHHGASVTFHDPWTGILFTGDTVLPGRLYVDDLAAFTDTLDRLTAFARTHQVTWVLGCHTEMKRPGRGGLRRRPGRDYPLGATYQPDELPPQLPPERLAAIAAAAAAARPGQVSWHEDFALYAEPGKRTMLALIARGTAAQGWRKLRHTIG